jgi:hypothetical protein
MIPVITTIGLQVGVLMAGAILTETIFSWPGIGKWMIDSISRRDYPVVQAGLLLIAGLVMLVNLLVDLTLWPHQPEDPPAMTDHRRRQTPRCRDPRRMLARVLVLFPPEPRRRRRPVGLRLAGARGALRAADRAACPTQQYRDALLVPAGLAGRAGDPSSCWAPMRSAATCCRG